MYEGASVTLRPTRLTPVELAPLPDPRPRLPVIQVTGTGRNGSTILSEILSAADGVINLGEMWLTWSWFAQGNLCSCGDPLPQCPFWSEVVDRALGPMKREDFEELGRLQRQTVRKRRLQELLWPRHVVADDLRLADLQWEELFRAALAISGGRWLIESSTEDTFPLFLGQIPDLDIRMVHLVRDPRGFAYSCMKPDIPIPKVVNQEVYMPVDPVRRSAKKWITKNTLLELFAASRVARYHLLRYEDMLVRPAESLTALGSALEVPLPSMPDQPGDPLATGTFKHTIAGNPLVEGPLSLRFDDKWKAALSASDQRLVTALCAPLMVKYRYPLAVQSLT